MQNDKSVQGRKWWYADGWWRGLWNPSKASLKWNRKGELIASIITRSTRQRGERRA